MLESFSHLHDPHDGSLIREQKMAVYKTPAPSKPKSTKKSLTRLKNHLYEKLAVLLDVFVRLLLLDFLLRLHRNVYVDAKLFVPVIVKQSQLRRGTAVVNLILKAINFFFLFFSFSFLTRVSGLSDDPLSSVSGSPSAVSSSLHFRRMAKTLRVKIGVNVSQKKSSIKNISYSQRL